MTSKSYDYNMDEIDKIIIKELSSNSRTPYTKISKKISKEIKHLSVGTIHVRVKKLESIGVIKRSSLIIGYEFLGFKIIAFLRIISNYNKSELIKEKLKKVPNIVQLYETSGKYNFFCKIFAKDHLDMKKIIFNIGIMNGITEINTTICLEENINDENRLISI